MLSVSGAGAVAVKVKLEAPAGEDNTTTEEDNYAATTYVRAPADVDFICPFPNCAKRFSRARSLRLHEFLHQDVKPHCCEVEGCSASYSRKQHLIRHIEANHSNPGAEFKCTRDGCVATFDNKTSLDRHIIKKHRGFKTEDERFKCDICSSSFIEAWQLQEHLVTHGQENPFRCEYCDEAFDVYLLYKTHLKESHMIRLTYKNEKCVIQGLPNKCDYCGAHFKKWRQLGEHCRTEHPFRCEYCLQTFRNRSRLKAHSCEQNQTRERFRCTEAGCTKSYLHERNLRIHVRTAHKGEVHMCPQCEQKLTSKQKLQEHITKIHENPKSPSRRGRRPKSVKQSLVERLTGTNDHLSLYGIPKLGPQPEVL